MLNKLAFLFSILVLTSCGRDQNTIDIDIQGHRGARGLAPENSISGMLVALRHGVQTLDMDVVITRDQKVVLSHEPFLSHVICTDAEGNPISVHNEMEYNIYEMTYDSLRGFDCGSLGHPDFPEQEKMKTTKPLLSDVISAVKQYCDSANIELPHFSIEIKMDKSLDLIYQPGAPDFVKLVMNVVVENEIQNHTIIQSFDPRPLRIVNGRYPEIQTSWLLDDKTTLDSALLALGFRPDIISPNHQWLDTAFIAAAQRDSMRVIPWTVNDKSRAEELIKMGVDGLITDYPDRISKATLGK